MASFSRRRTVETKISQATAAVIFSIPRHLRFPSRRLPCIRFLCLREYSIPGPIPKSVSAYNQTNNTEHALSFPKLSYQGRRSQDLPGNRKSTGKFPIQKRRTHWWQATTACRLRIEDTAFPLAGVAAMPQPRFLFAPSGARNRPQRPGRQVLLDDPSAGLARNPGQASERSSVGSDAVSDSSSSLVSNISLQSKHSTNSPLSS